MSTANTTFRVTELDFLTIKENLKDFLRNQSEFQDFDFDGSGINVLLDLLAVNTHYLSFYLNVDANESFLDTAQLRESIISRAKALCYVPASRQGALVKANILVTPSGTEDQGINVITLDRYTKFLGKDIDGINYPFVALNSNTAAKVNSSFLFANVYLKQGEVVSHQFLMSADNEKRRFTIPSANVDTTTLSVSVQESSSNSMTEAYSLGNDITEVDSESRIYYVEEDNESTYTFYFGDDVLGKKPRNGNIVICTYVDTVGSPANNISTFYQSDPIGSLFTDNVRITTASASYGGTDRETIEQVRYRAPYFYTTQNRAVTTLDYETLITKDYNNIDSVSVWGGEDNDPVVYGKVYLSLKTRGNYQLTNLEKERIKADLIRTRNVVTVTPEIVDPDYTYLLLKGRVYYNPTLTSLTAEEIGQFVRATILDYNDAELNTFRSTFRKSKLQYMIDNAEKSITSSDLHGVYLQKRVSLDTTKNKSYDVKFNTVLQKGDFNDKMFSIPEVQVLDYNGISRNIFFEEKPFSDTGVDIITILNGGINYFTAPTITITGDGSDATAEAVVKNGVITKINILEPGINYTRAEIVIDGEGSGARAIARLEARTGRVRSYYFRSTGEKVILNEDVGTINYDTGSVFIDTFLTQQGTPVDRYYDTDIVTINFPIENEVIRPLRNRILTIDGNDPIAIQMEIIAES